MHIGASSVFLRREKRTSRRHVTPGGLSMTALRYHVISIEQGYVEGDLDEDGKVSEQDSLNVDGAPIASCKN